MLCLRLSLPCRHDLSQASRKARVRRCPLGFDPSGRPHLLGTSRHSFLRIRNLLDRYLMDPSAAIGGSLVLLFRPPLMDILPMYVLFSLLTPSAFGAARRWGWKTVLFLSFLLWVGAQTDVR